MWVLIIFDCSILSFLFFNVFSMLKCSGKKLTIKNIWKHIYSGTQFSFYVRLQYDSAEHWYLFKTLIMFIMDCLALILIFRNYCIKILLFFDYWVFLCRPLTLLVLDPALLKSNKTYIKRMFIKYNKSQ